VIPLALDGHDLIACAGDGHRQDRRVRGADAATIAEPEAETSATTVRPSANRWECGPF
jgi:hypothetical protein